MTKLLGTWTVCLAFVISGCTSNLTSRDASPDTQPVVTAAGGCSGTAKLGGTKVPAEHRATAAACAPSRNPFADGGFDVLQLERRLCL